MAGNRGLQGLIKQPAPKAMWTHCMIHRKSRTMKEFCSELSEVMGTVIKTGKYIKIGPLESRLFAELCKEIGAQYQSLLFYCNSHWQQRGKVVARVYKLENK
jgi:hypothetical protein